MGQTNSTSSTSPTPTDATTDGATPDSARSIPHRGIRRNLEIDGLERNTRPATYTVKRPEVSSAAIVCMQDFELHIERWNCHYDFYGIAHNSSATDRRLTNPQYLFIQAPLRFIASHYQYFTLAHLRTIAGAHSVTYRGKTKYNLQAYLIAHQCGPACTAILYVFKESTRPRSAIVWSTRRRLPPTWRSSTVAIETEGTPTPVTVTQNTQIPVTPREQRNGEQGSTPRIPSTRNSSPISVQAGGDSPILVDTTHLDPTPEHVQARIIAEWQKEMDISTFIRSPCAACSSLKNQMELERVHANTIPLHLLRNNDLPPSVKPISYNLRAYEGAILEPMGLEDTQSKGFLRLCLKCKKDLANNRMPKFALCNWLYYARDRVPEHIRQAFAKMTVFEKALISRIRVNSLMCRFTGIDDDISNEAGYISSRRRHIRGNIISSPMDVGKINDVLPPSPRDIGDTICAIIVSNRPPTDSTIEKLEPMLVRKSRIKSLIEFLLANNPHYRVSRTFRGFSPEHLDALFHGHRDRAVPKSVKIAHISRSDAVEAAISDYTGRLDGLEGLFMENVAFTLGDLTSMSLRDMSLRAVQRCKDGRPFLYVKPGSNPVPDIDNPNWLSWAHPAADPFGIGGFHEPRRTRPIGMELQLKHLLNVYDPFFENDPQLAFDVHNILRKSAVNTSLRFSVPYRTYSRVIDEIVRIDKRRITELAYKFSKNPFYKPETTEEIHILRTMSSISPTARNVPGSAAQRIKMRNEIRAIISQRGSPTLFITLNPADYHNSVMVILANRCTNAEEVIRATELTEKERTDIALKHPVACTQFFDAFIKQFVRTILGYGRKKAGLFGKCDAYYGTVEAQGRGSLHCHMLVWLKGHLPPETLQSTLRVSEAYRTKLTTWLDSFIDSGFIGTRSYLNEVTAQDTRVSSQDDELRRRGQQPGTETGPLIAAMDRVLFWKEFKEHVDDLLARYYLHEHKPTCWKYLKPSEKTGDNKCRFGLDGTTRPSTELDLESGAINIRRRHPKITQYNPITTFLMKCNTDLKFIGSGEEAKAFMYYVTDYITKSPLSIHAGLSALTYAISKGEQKGILSETGRDEFDNRRAMTITVNSMLGRQEISHPQAMSYILGHGESYTSEAFQPANWGETVRYVKHCISPNQPQTNHLGETSPINDLQMAIATEQGQIQASNQLLDYIYRPEVEPFGSMNLYAHFSSTQKSTQPIENRNRPRRAVAGQPFQSERHPQFRTHVLKLRKSHVTPVLLGPRIARKQGTEGETEDWSRDMCILFKPWRHPSDLKAPEEPWSRALERLTPSLSAKELRILDSMSLIAEAKFARDKNPRGQRRNEARDQAGEADVEATMDVDEDDIQASVSSNVFSLLQPRMEHEARDRETDLSSHLERLIGAEATDAFELCLPRGVPADSNTTPPQPSIVDGIQIRHQIERHQYFMSRHKIRDPNQDTDEQEGPVARNASRFPDTLPSVNIATIAMQSEATTHRKFMSWRIAESIIHARNLHENAEQLKAFRIFAHHVIEGGTQLLMYVGGKGGTGKSYIINAIVELFRSLRRSKELRLGAPTGIAAALIGGNTLHSLLGMNPANRNTNRKRLCEEWKEVRYLVIDEVSMIGAHFMASISSQLRAAKAGMLSDSAKIFGGINILFLGDFLQLSPPKQPSLFAHRLIRNPTFVNTRDNSGIDAIAGAYLWRQVRTVVTLQQNQRQSSDLILGEILERMRNNTCIDRTGKAVQINGLSVLDHLRKRELTHLASHNPSELADFVEAPVIVGSKILRDTLNACLLTAHADRLRIPLHLYHATDSIRGKSVPAGIADRLKNLPTRITNESLGLLPLFIGMKVMVTENVSVPYSIVNGSEGTITDIKFSLDNLGRRLAEVVYVRIPNCGIDVPGLEKGIAPIFPTQVSIQYNTMALGVRIKSFRRLQVPLVPAYAYTDYKSQGRTLQRAIVDIASARGQGIYVMLSRVTTLRGLVVLRWFPNSKVVQRMSGELREETKRLHALSEETSRLYHLGLLTPHQTLLPISSQTLNSDDIAEMPEESRSQDSDSGDDIPLQVAGQEFHSQSEVESNSD